MKHKDNKQEPVKVLEVATFKVRPPHTSTHQQSLFMLVLSITVYFSRLFVEVHSEG